MEQYELVYETLKNMNITYDIVEHPPVFTTEEADSYIEGMEGVRTKSLFLNNKKKTAYYLLIMDDSKQLDMNRFKEIVGEKQLSFSSSERLMEKVSLQPGAVSIFGLINNKEKDIKVFLDKEILSERLMSFHPNDNTKTIFISTEDMYKFIKDIGYEYNVVEI
ncbi:prolyl-tRNA synthetase associated domain-containing protein [[Clostridium] dakarense]|uniref:prolyl-tRNA synthetase associated domain-containing protein n=1 Tax=Faecalimicrobium dakarense TaxID=1301100 RepID=UPI0004B8D4D0|nr:prolyl-tRNA synthetase associated domain-containing protein [[Clostridium] dakarense]